MVEDPRAPPITAFLADLLAVAIREDCGCRTCRTLREAWPRMGLPDPPPSVPMCTDCAAHPKGARILRGAVGVAGLGGIERCVLCGAQLEPVNDESPASR
jgi:hypothetical protein